MTVTEYICYFQIHAFHSNYGQCVDTMCPIAQFELAHTKQSFKLHILEYDLTNCVFRYLKKH